MSATLWALIISASGMNLVFQPGYASRQECQAVYSGPHVICWQYDPSLTTWTAFFKTAEGPGTLNGFGAIWRFPNQSTCQVYINALKPEAYGACRQLSHPETCPVACRAPDPPPTTPPPPAPPTVKPESFGDVSIGPSKLTERDIPTIDPYTPPPKEQVRNRYARTAALRRPASTGPATYDTNPLAIIASLFAGSW
jgi:hypothetical protein